MNFFKNIFYAFFFACITSECSENKPIIINNSKNLNIEFIISKVLDFLKTNEEELSKTPENKELIAKIFQEKNKTDQIKLLNKFFQANFLRKGERWDDQRNFENLKDLDKLFDAFSLFEEIKSSKKKFSFALILGSTSISLKARINFYKVQDFDLKFGTFLLTGNRNLNKDELRFLELNYNLQEDQLKELQTESDLAHFLIEKAEIDAELVTCEINESRRANTADTVKKFIEKNEEAILQEEVLRIAIISDQPFGLYQLFVVYNVFKKYFESKNIKKEFVITLFSTTFEKKQSKEHRNAIALDSIARIIYVIDELNF